MKKFRLYYDKDKETLWLQRMANQGWALEGFFLGVYTFTPCEPGEYRYQIDFLENTADFENYRQLMEDSGVEVACRWFRWVILRKKVADGPFVLYTDAESLIRHYGNIRALFRAMAGILLVCFLTNLVNYMINPFPAIILLDLIPACVAVVMLRMVWRCSWKIEQLRESANS